MILILGISFENQAYGHGCQAMIQSRDFRIEDVTFSRRTISVGESLEIQGLLVNMNSETKELKPWAVASISEPSYFVDDIMRIFSGQNGGCFGGPSDGQLNWYFTIETKPTNKFVLEPEGVIPYYVSLTPLKAGIYHIHPAILWNEWYRNGPGQTIIVEGRDGVTDGEIFGFYLPFISSVIGISFAAIIGIIGIRRKMQTNHSSKGKLS